MSDTTEHLGLKLNTLGSVEFKASFVWNMNALDELLGDIAGVETIEGDSIAEKLTALEARVAALEA